MGNFSGVGNARSSKGGVYFLPGNYLTRIEKVSQGTSRNNIDFLVVEAEILESDNPERKPGTVCSWLLMADKDAFLGNVNHFASAAFGIDESEVDEAGCEMMCGEENPVRGTLLRVQATNIKTRAGKDFTKLVWRASTPVDEKKYGKAA